MDATDYYFAVSLLDHLYWIGGSLIGAAAGNLITFDTTGVDFAMTALFVVLAVEQWKSNSRHAPALFGLCFGIASLLIFGADLFLIPALVAIAAALLLARRRLEGSAGASEGTKKERGGHTAMNIDAFYTALIILVAAAVTFGTRLLAFVIFGGRKGRRTAQMGHLSGSGAPPAVIALLIVYCLRSIDLFSGTHGLPELLCVAVCALLHLWKRNELLSIFRVNDSLYGIGAGRVPMNRLSLFIGGVAFQTGPRFAARKVGPFE